MRRAPSKARREPPPFVITSRDSEELSRLRASIARAERVLRSTGDPWAALAVLGITTRGGKPGRRGISARELARLGDLFENMTTAPGRAYGRVPERLDLLFEHSAAVIAAQRTGSPLPPAPDELFYVADCDAPMSPEDALRNVAKYHHDAGQPHILTLLKRASKQREQEGRPPLDLPSRPPPAAKL